MNWKNGAVQRVSVESDGSKILALSRKIYKKERKKIISDVHATAHHLRILLPIDVVMFMCAPYMTGQRCTFFNQFLWCSYPLCMICWIFFLLLFQCLVCVCVCRKSIISRQNFWEKINQKINAILYRISALSWFDCAVIGCQFRIIRKFCH